MSQCIAFLCLCVSTLPSECFSLVVFQCKWFICNSIPVSGIINMHWCHLSLASEPNSHHQLTINIHCQHVKPSPQRETTKQNECTETLNDTAKVETLFLRRFTSWKVHDNAFIEYNWILKPTDRQYSFQPFFNSFPTYLTYLRDN